MPSRRASPGISWVAYPPFLSEHSRFEVTARGGPRVLLPARPITKCRDAGVYQRIGFQRIRAGAGRLCQLRFDVVFARVHHARPHCMGSTLLIQEVKRLLLI